MVNGGDMTSGLFRNLGHLWRRLTARRHRSQTTDYAKAANEMAGRNLSHALRPRMKGEEAKIIATCLEAGFPLSSDEASERLRAAVARVEQRRKTRR